MLDAALDIPPLDRFPLYAHLGLVRVMEPHTETLMQERAQALLEDDEYDSPHSRPWFVSFHGSEFPGVPESACSRYLTYRAMNFPATSAMPPWVTTTGTLGKAGELDIADAWFKGGRLLAVPESAEEESDRLEAAVQALLAGDTERGMELAEQARYHQLGFVDPEVWFTVSTDLPILPPGWTRPYICEVKCKADDVVEEMLQGRLIQHPDGRLEKIGRGPDEKHAVQLKATIGQAHEYDWGEVVVCKHSWRILGSQLHERLGVPGGLVYGTDAFFCCPEHKYDCQHSFQLEPPTSGEVYYWSRSWPRKTKSFYYEHDPAFMAAGKEVLAETRQAYIENRLPDRPAHFGSFSIGPCTYCSFKPFCRLDSGLAPRKRKPDPELQRHKLTESHGVEHARSLRPTYDPEAVRARVFEEWQT